MIKRFQRPINIEYDKEAHRGFIYRVTGVVLLYVSVGDGRCDTQLLT